MQYRHEWKHEISYADLLTLRTRLGALMRRDGHTGGVYTIRSLYFDTPDDRALREKLDGTDRREKFRIRCYNGDPTFLRLEKKSKRGGLCAKQSARLTADEAERILRGELSWMPSDTRPLVTELYAKMRSGLRPKTVVEYTREAFVFPAGNVRATLDYNIRTGLSSTDFLRPGFVTVPAGDAPILLEVKWDEFLPDCIRAAVGLTGRHAAAFSKYAQCRIYG